MSSTQNTEFENETRYLKASNHNRIYFKIHLVLTVHNFEASENFLNIQHAQRIYFKMLFHSSSIDEIEFEIIRGSPHLT